MRRAPSISVLVAAGLASGAAACRPDSALLPSKSTFSSTDGAGTDSGAPGTGLAADVPAGCPDPLSWANTGEPYLLTYCAGCHAEGGDPAFRYGAPPDLFLDSADDVHARSARVRARIADGTMPPTGGPSLAETECFLAWLDQGARGDGTPLGSGTAPPVAAVAWEVLETVDDDPDLPGTLLLTTTLVGLGRPVATGRFAEERWLVDGDDAWLLSRTRYDPQTDAVLSDDAWEPPLRLSWGSTDDGWTVETTRTHTDTAGTETLAEVWDVARIVGVATDPRSIDTAPVQVLAVERGAGLELGVELSARMGLVRRWSFDDTPTGDPELDLIDTLLFESRLPALGSGFPLGPDMEWSARILGDAP